MQIPTFKELEKAFQTIKNSKYNNISGVIKISSDIEGPNLGISICTHGNEPSGLAALWFCLKDDFLKNNIKKGNVFFVLNNVKGCEKSFSSETEEDRKHARFIDINFNRLPDNLLEIEDNSYEILRAKELYEVYKEFDIGFDIHSTSSKSEPMIIETGKVTPNLIKNFPIEIVITDIVEKLVGMPVVELYGGKDSHIPVLIIEAGHHFCQNAFENSIICTISLLHNLEMLDFSFYKDDEVNTFKEFKTVQSIMFPDENYELVKVFESFEKVKKGDLIAYSHEDKDGKIYSPCDGHILMPPVTTKADISEEIMYITENYKEVTY